MNDFLKKIFFYSFSTVYAIFIILSFCFNNSAGLILGIFAIIFIFFKIQKKGNIQFHPIDFVVLGLLSIEFIAGLFNTHDIYAKTYLFGLFFNVLIYFIIRIFIQKKKQENWFNSILAGFVILLAILTIGSFYFFKFTIEYEGFTDLVNFKSMFTPLGFLLNDWATILLLASSFVLLALVQSRFNTLWFWVLIAGLGAVLMSIVFSFSRGAYLSVLLGLFVFFCFTIIFRVVRFKQLLYFFIGTALLLTLTALPVKKEFITTMGLSGTTSQARSTMGRIELWKAAFQLIREEPLTGVGNGRFSLRANPYLAKCEDATFTGRATNSYLQLMAEKGIVGFIPWFVLISLLLLVLFRLIRKRDENRLSALVLFSVFIAVLFRELTFSTFFEKQQMQLFFFILAALIINNENKTKSRFLLPRLFLPIFLFLMFIISGSFVVMYKISNKKNNAFIQEFKEGNYGVALKSISEAIRFNPENPLLLANKGFLLNEILEQDNLSKPDNKENALAYYRKAVRHSPFDSYLQHNLAWLHSVCGKPDSAEYHQQKACELSANTAMFHLGNCKPTAKELPHGLNWKRLQKAIRLSPDILDAELPKDLQAQFPDSLHKILDNLVESMLLKIKTDDSPVIKSRLAKIELHLGNTITAMKLFEVVVAQLPNLDRPWYYMGMIKLAQKDTTNFIKYLNRAILLDSRDYLYTQALGDFHYQQNKERDAIYYYKNALFNYCNMYTHHALIAPKWYGYKTLPNDILPHNMLESTKPYMNKTEVCSKLVELYSSLGQIRESNLVKRYNNNEISIYLLFKELNNRNNY